jgi:hypothetical protein
MKDVLLLGAVAFAAWYFLRGQGTASSSPVQSLGTQFYNNPSDVFARMKVESGDGYMLLNDGQWRQLWAQNSTAGAPAVSIDPVKRVTLYDWWKLAFGSLPAGMGWLA